MSSGTRAAKIGHMNSVQMDQAQSLAAMDGSSLSLPMGLLGFEKTKRFHLQTVSEDSPLLWLEVAESISKGFYALCPDGWVDQYQPKFCQQDLDFLGLKDPSEAVILSLATVKPDGEITLHLRAPILINPITQVGKQVVPNNVEEIPACVPIAAPAVLAA